MHRRYLSACPIIQSTILVALQLLIVWGTSSAQELVWRKVNRSDEAYTDLRCISPAIGGGYVGAGSSRLSWRARQSDDDDRQRLTVSRFDQRGTLVWQKQIVASPASHGISIAPTGDSGYMVIASGELDYYAFDRRDTFPLIKVLIDTAGAVRSISTIIDTSRRFTANRARRTRDGGYLLAGCQQRWPALARLDRNGGLMWVTPYRIGATVGWATGAYELSDGGVIVAATSLGGDPAMSMLAIRVSERGGIVWSQEVKWDRWETGNDIVPLSDGSFMAIGASMSGWSLRGQRTFIARLDRDGTIRSMKTMDDYDIAYCGAIEPTSDGGFVIAGALGDYNTKVMITRMNGVGEILWQRRHPGRTDALNVGVCVYEAADEYVIGIETDGDVGLMGVSKRER